MTLMTLQPVLPVENIFPQKSPTGITGQSVISVMEAFPVGCAVHVRVAPHGTPGEVIGHFRGKVEVRFPSIHYAGRFRAESLILESEVSE